MRASQQQIRVGPLGSFLAVLVRQTIPFGGFLMLLAFSWLHFISPWLEMRASQSWPEVVCQPIEGATGWRYAYEFAGQGYESDRLNLYENPPGNLEDLKAKFRRGETVTGYVNPSNPATAVLSREDANNEKLGRIVLGFFVLAFCSGVTAAWLSGMDKWTAAKAGRAKKVSPVTRFCESVVYATLVNSFVSVVIIAVSSAPNAFLMKAFFYLCLTPFVLLGLLMIYAIFRNFMLIFTEERSLTSGRK